MRRSRFLPLATLALALLGPTARADIIYNFANYPAVQKGYTISGTITTDGSTGALTSTSFIKSWAFSLSGPEGVFSASSAGNGHLVLDKKVSSGNDVPTLFVTSTSIKLAVNTQLAFTDEFQFTLLTWARNNANNALIIFGQGRDPYDSPVSLFYYEGFNPGAASPIATAQVTSTPAVPEPSSLAVAACGGLVGLIALARRRRR